MSRTVCNDKMCCGCSACKTICPKEAIEIQDEMQYLNAIIDEDKCINCNLCKKVCPNNGEPELKKPVEWYQGWALNSNIRNTSASGGIARTISEEFIKNGGEVCSCLFENGEFNFRIIRTISELNKFQGSKYVKSNPKNIYRGIKEELKKGVNVLFIGLPCQVQAVQNYVGDDLRTKLYTVDLICHGTPSVKFLERFLQENNKKLSNLDNISFRTSDGLGIKGGTKLESPGVMDKYSIAFFNSMCHTENCYACKFANIERTSDLTIGDSWGSEIRNEIYKGISLMLCQNEKGYELINNKNIVLYPVDLDKAINNNPQLKSSCTKPLFYQGFFDEIKNGGTIDKAVIKYQRIKSIKQIIKKVLLKMHLMKISGGYMISIHEKEE